VADIVGIRSDRHAANGIGFQMFPHKLIWIAVGRIGRQKKQPQFAAQSFNEDLRLLRAMRGTAIDNEKDRLLGARDQAFQELDWQMQIVATRR
jgi:hypothetical protein